MAEKLTYEELEQRVKELEKTVLKRKSAEEALIESEKLHRLIVENVTDTIWIVDMEIKFTYFSPSVTQMRGYSVKEAMAQSVEESMTPASFESAMKMIAEELELHNKMERDPNRPRKMEAELTCKDGSTVWTEIEANFIYNSEGQPTGIVGITRNITERKESEKERKRTEEALRKSEENYRLLVKNLPGVVYKGYKDWSVEFADKKSELLAGYDVDEFNSKRMKWSDIIVKEYIEAAKDSFIKALKSDKEYVREYRIDSKLGDTHWIQERGQIICDDRGEIEYVNGVFFDITEHKRSEEQVLIANERLQYLLSSTAAVIYTAKASGDYSSTFISDNVTQMVGYEPKEFIESSSFWFDNIHAEDKPRISEEVSHIFERKLSGYEYRFLHKDGRYIWVRDEMKLIRDKDGNPIEIIGFWADITDRKKAEEALREIEERFRTAFEDAATGIALMGKNGYFLKVNQTLCRILGYSEEELMGKTWVEITEPDDLSGCFDWLKRVKAGEQSAHEKRFIHKLGYPLWVMVSSSAIRDSQDQIRYYISLFHDISKRKEVEEALQDSRNMLRTVLDSIPSAVFWKDRDSVYLGGNRSWLKAIGTMSLEEIVGKSDYDLPWKREQADSFREDDSRVMESGIPEYGIIERYLRADGTPAWAKTNKVPLRDAEGTVTGVLGTYEDITDRKQAEEELRESEIKFRTLVERLPAITYSAALDESSTTLYISPQIEERLGISPEKYKEYPDFWVKHLHDEDRERVLREVSYAHETGQPFISEYRMISADGRLLWFSDEAVIIKDDEGIPINLQGVMLDITERKRMEEELLRAQKLQSLGVFAGGIAHDFNNILTTILGNVSIAKMGVSPEDEMFDLLNEAEMASTRAQILTKQLLTFAKGGAPVKEIASIKTILKGSSSFVLHGSKSGCEFSIEEDLWPAEVDIGQISQVINNIVINADQAMPEGGTIQVAAENLIIEGELGLPVKLGKYIRISIKDQGMGIAENHLFNIFDPYFTTKQEGSGIGLATTYSIIKKHDGHITVESQLGVGTTFHIYLPASDKIVPEKEESRLIKGHGRILVMDDEVPLRKMVGRMLEMLGYESEAAKDGAEAVRMVKEAKKAEKPYDAVILDLTIPGGMGGKEAIIKLLEIDPEVKAIVTSGYYDDPVLANFQEYGFKGMMPKPFESRSLSKVLHEVLKGKGKDW